MEILVSFIHNFWDMFVDMAFYIVIGLLCVGFLNTYVKKEKIIKHLGNNKFSSVVKASVVGVPLPLCSCGVVPTAVELKKGGASNGAVVSFLVSTPQTGIDSMLATYSMMGLVMAIFRPVAAFFSGIFCGTVINLFAKYDSINIDAKVKSHCGCGHEHGHEHHHEEEHHSCACGCGHEAPKASRKLANVFNYAFGSFLDDIAVHFLIGMFLATIIATFVPADFFVSMGLDSGIIAMLAMVLIGLPMYICSTASIPIAMSLVTKGLSFGGAFVFLFTGPVTNIVSLLILSKVLGKKITALYISSVVFCSIVFGLILDYIMTTYNFEFISSGSFSHVTSSYIEPAVAVFFAIMLIRSLYKRNIAK